MPSLFDPKTKADILARLERLDPDTTPLWGKMNAEEMLCHCADGIRMALGDRPVEDKSNIFTRTVVKFAILNLARMPKNVPTSPELDQRKQGTRSEGFEHSMAALLSEIKRADERSENDHWGSHLLFGRLTRREWGVLGFKHMDHHLRQFGI